MSAYSDYANAVGRIYQRQAALAADTQRQKGALIGGTIATLGQIPQVVQQQRQQEQQLKAKQQQQQLENQLKVAELQQRQQALDAKADPRDSEKKDIDLKLARYEAAARQLLNAKPENWHARRPIVQDILKTDLPEEWPGDEAIAAMLDEGHAYKDQLEARQKALEEANKKPPLVPIPGPEGKPVYGVPQEGQPVYEKPSAEGKPPSVGSFEDYVTRTYGANPTPAQVIAARKAYGQADDRPRVDVNVGGAAATGLDPGGLELAATDYRLTHRLPARNAGQNGAIISAAAKQAKDLGNTPVATIQKQAAYAGDSKALAKMQGMSAAAEAFESKAIAQTGIIKELSAQVSRTKYPIINAALQAGRTQIQGDENATKLANAIETFSEEYAKIMNGSTGSSASATDSARTAAKRLINTAMSKGTMDGVLDLMQRDMDLTLAGYGSVIAHITERMGGAQMAAPSSGVPVVGGTFQGGTVLKVTPVP